MVAVEDHYAILGVERSASADEIKSAYRRLTLENHPDRRPGDQDAALRYRQINRAYAVLGDESARRRYDASLRVGEGIDLARNIDGQTARDLLGNVFGDLFGSKRRKRRKGRDLRYTLSVSFEEAVLGSAHEIKFEAAGSCSTCHGVGTKPGGRTPDPCPRCAGAGEVKGEGLFARRTRCGRCDGTGLIQIDPCPDCRGRGSIRQGRSFQVRLPPGTDPGATKVLTGQGEPGRFGGEPGDLRVTINQRPHRWLSRSGDDVVCEVPISVTEAARGAKVPVPTVDGVVRVDVPPEVRSGTKLRLRQKGVPRPGKTRGDQLVTVVVETPVIVGHPEVGGSLDQLERQSHDASVLPRRHEQRQALEDEPDDPR